MTIELNEQQLLRRAKLQKLEELGIDAFPAAGFDVTHYSAEIKANFDAKPEDYTKVRLAGRMMTQRIMGKAAFAVLQDAEGRIQLYVSRDDIAPSEDKTMYNDVFKKLLDIGDIIGVEG